MFGLVAKFNKEIVGVGKEQQALSEQSVVGLLVVLVSVAMLFVFTAKTIAAMQKERTS